MWTARCDGAGRSAVGDGGVGMGGKLREFMENKIVPLLAGLCPFGNSKCGPKTLCFQRETDFVMSSQFADIEESSATTRSCNNVSATDSPIDGLGCLP